MAYQVLARKYRPQTFEDVVAQEHVTRTLRNAVKNNRIGSGYLFCGPRGTGKTTTARILAKALNCINGPTPTPCGECPACLEIASGNSLDVLEIDAASNTGVDDVRALRENVRYLPTSGKKRIFIIDEVHRLSGAAFDALLKTLEEPPEHVVFVFATTEPLKVPETILSRTQRFDFKRVSITDLAGHLKKVADREQIQIDDTALALLARKADGSVRDSLSLLDQVAAFAGEKITETDIVEALGLVDRNTLFDLTNAIAANDSKATLQLIRNVSNSGVDAKDFLTELLDHFRILLLISVDPDAGTVQDIGNDEMTAYKEQSAYYCLGDIIRLMKITADMLADLKSGLDERLVLEMGGVKMATLESTVRFEEILDYIKQNPVPSSSAPTDLFNSAEKKSAETTSLTLKRSFSPQTDTTQPFTSTTCPSLPQIKARWSGFMELVKQRKTMLASQLAMAELREVRDNKLVLAFGTHGAASLQVIQKPENMMIIKEALTNHYRAPIDIICISDTNSKAASGIDISSQQRPFKTDVTKLVKQSPRLKMLIEKVNGEIIGVKRTK